MFAPTIDLEKATLPQLQEEMRAAADYLTGLQQKRAGGNIEDQDSFRKDVESARSFLVDMDPVVQFKERDAQAEARAKHQQASALLQLPQSIEMRSLGAMFTGAEAYSEWAKRSGTASATSIELDVEGSIYNYAAQGYQQRDLLSGVAADGGVFAPIGQPIPPRVRMRRLFVRDMLSVQTTGLHTVPYIQETTPATDELGATTVLEAGAKPEVAMHWSLQDAPIRKIAAWVPATSEVIEDAPTLRGYIDTRLAYYLAVREELQILAGNGTAPNLKGILAQSGLQSQVALTAAQAVAASTVRGDTFVTIGSAIALVENVDGEPDGLVLNPIDFWQAVTKRQSTFFDGDAFGGGVGGAPFAGPPLTVWGLAATRSRAITAGSALLGAFQMGATLFDREQTTIRVGNQHSDYFTTNKVAILAEERIGLAVHRPDMFVTVAFVGV